MTAANIRFGNTILTTTFAKKLGKCKYFVCLYVY